MTEKELLDLVEPKWHQEFLQFIHTGTASKDFLKYAEVDFNCKKAIDMAFTDQARSLEELALIMRNCMADGDIQSLIHAVKNCRFTLT